MGVHVLVEKPMAMSLHDADQMIAKAQEMQVFLGVCQQNRLNDSTQLVKKALDCGAFGKLSHGSLAVRWSRAQDYYDQAPWRGKWESDGGTLMNQCIHGLDLLRWFMGSNVKSVTSHLANRFHPYLEVEDVGIGVVLFCDGSVATIEGTTNVYEDNLEESITLIGQKGSVVLGGQVADEIKYWHFENEEVDGWGKNLDVKPFSSVYGNGHVRIYSDFIDSIQNHHRPYVDGKDGRNALEMVLSMYESHRLGKSVNLPLQEASTSDMQGINLGFIS
jgi:predicted dehydrogenase